MNFIKFFREQWAVAREWIKEDWAGLPRYGWVIVLIGIVIVGNVISAIV